MYFTDIRSLKIELAQGPLTSREAVKYVGAQGLFYSFVYVPAGLSPALWMFVASAVVTIAGIGYCYRCNGGRDGERFVERWLTVGWVTGIRAALLAVPCAAVILGLQLLRNPDDTTLMDPWFMPAMYFVIAAIYWRMGVHLKDIHQRILQT